LTTTLVAISLTRTSGGLASRLHNGLSNGLSLACLHGRLLLARFGRAARTAGWGRTAPEKGEDVHPATSRRMALFARMILSDLPSSADPAFAAEAAASAE
jgi:hypothetical protein